MANKRLDLAGQKFGMLTASHISALKPIIMWHCVCDCGGEKDVHSAHLKAGVVKSCGCLLTDTKDTWKAKIGTFLFEWECVEYLRTGAQGHIFTWKHSCGRTVESNCGNIKRGHVARCECEPKPERDTSMNLHAPTRNTHKSMLARCLNPEHSAFPRYGGRGIEVDPRWLDYNLFVSDMGLRPDGLELDRKNNELGYNKDNCRWVSRESNLRNTSVNRLFEYKGEMLCVAEIADMAGIPYARASARLTRYGWSVEQTLGGKA